MMQQTPRTLSPFEQRVRAFALATTQFVGSPLSIFLHTIVFAVSFTAVWFGLLEFDRMLLVLTTIVSLEAIYLSIFIQMSINYTSETVADIQEDVADIQEDVDDIQKDVDEIQEDVEEIQEDVEELNEDEEGVTVSKPHDALETLESHMKALLQEIERVRASRGSGK